MNNNTNRMREGGREGGREGASTIHGFSYVNVRTSKVLTISLQALHIV